MAISGDNILVGAYEANPVSWIGSGEVSFYKTDGTLVKTIKGKPKSRLGAPSLAPPLNALERLWVCHRCRIAVSHSTVTRRPCQRARNAHKPPPCVAPRVTVGRVVHGLRWQQWRRGRCAWLCRGVGQGVHLQGRVGKCRQLSDTPAPPPHTMLYYSTQLTTFDDNPSSFTPAATVCCAVRDARGMTASAYLRSERAGARSATDRIGSSRVGWDRDGVTHSHLHLHVHVAPHGQRPGTYTSRDTTNSPGASKGTGVVTLYHTLLCGGGARRHECFRMIVSCTYRTLTEPSTKFGSITRTADIRRPEVLYGICFLCTFVTTAGKEHLQRPVCVRDLMGYLTKTKHLGTGDYKYLRR